MRTPTNRRAHPHAFTLTELLVVLAIVGILVAIIIPILSSARSSARASQCKSNLRQVGVAALLYAQENKGFFPPGRTGWSAAQYWPAWLGDIKYNSTNTDQIFTCPSMYSEENYYSLNLGTPRGTIYATYAANTNLCGSFNGTQIVAQGGQQWKLNNVSQPSKTSLYTENTAYSYAQFSYTRTDSDFFRYPHGGTQNFVFCDGHVEALGKQQIPSSATNVFWTGGVLN